MYHAREGEQRVSVLDVDEKRLRKELAKARTRLERRPDYPSWLELEPVARVLHWLGDPEAAGCFRRAAADRAPRADDARWYLAVGNYHRLAGDPRPAKEWLERAHGAIAEVTSGGSSGFTYKTHSAYLLGRYEEVATIGERWGHEHLPMVALSRARLAADAGLAREVVEELSTHIRRHRITLNETGSVLHSWDRLELAIQATLELEGRSVEALAPLELLGRLREGQDPREEEPTRTRLTKARVMRTLDGQDEEPDLSYADLAGMDLSGVDFTNAILMGADLGGADLSGAVFVEANLSGADLRRAKLEGTLLQQADLSRAKLEDADLGAVEDKNLTYANLSGTDLSGSDLSSVDLRLADLSGANLRGVNLSAANLSSADLTGADLTGADLRGARLEHADFEDAVMDDVPS